MIKGKWHLPKSSAASDAELSLTAAEYVLHTLERGNQVGSVDDIQISDRLGNIPRKIVFPDGSMFETLENDAIDAWQKKHRQQNNWLHQFESSMRLALLGVVVTAITVVLFYQYGLPAASKGLAYLVPDSIRQSLTDQTMESLDDSWFEASELPEARQAEIKAEFAEVLRRLELNPEDFPVAFRQMSIKRFDVSLPWEESCDTPDATSEPGSSPERICDEPERTKLDIPNAFALPAGQVVFTDALVKLSESQDELNSIFLHEIAHVEQRHALQQMVRSSIITISLALMLGDVSGFEEIAVGIPVLLLGSKYSREFEAEADQYSFDRMITLNIDPINFANIMQRMEMARVSLSETSEEGNQKDSDSSSNSNSSGTKGSNSKDSDYKDSEENESNAIAEYLSSHPATKKRVEAAKQASQRMQNR